MSNVFKLQSTASEIKQYIIILNYQIKFATFMHYSVGLVSLPNLLTYACPEYITSEKGRFQPTFHKLK
jgi:hypothetical protein